MCVWKDSFYTVGNIVVGEEVVGESYGILSQVMGRFISYCICVPKYNAFLFP